jgi:hypothetical protein
MGAKVRCPGCGAKNDQASRRCRVCTLVLNSSAPELEVTPEPTPAATDALADHFDAGVIDRQLRPAKSRFTGPSGLSSRLASAASNRGAGPSDEPAAPEAIAPSPPEPAPPSEPEVFDPDALFRDMDRDLH